MQIYILFVAFLNLKETTPSHSVRADLEHFDGMAPCIHILLISMQ